MGKYHILEVSINKYVRLEYGESPNALKALTYARFCISCKNNLCRILHKLRYLKGKLGWRVKEHPTDIRSKSMGLSHASNI